MSTSTTHTDTVPGIRVRAVSAGRLLISRLREFHDGGVRAQYVIWDRLCDFGDDQVEQSGAVAAKTGW